jgi:hypothetical protein
MMVTFRRLLAPVVALAAVVSGIAMARPAAAAVVTPFAVQYDKAVFGDFVIAGNTVTTCPTSATWASPNCAIGRASNSSALGTAYINDVYYMEYTDVDGDPTTYNSSTARITIPAGATVDYARLWWVGNTGDAVRSDGVTPWFACNASQPNTAAPNQATAPSGYANAPFVPSTAPVKFKINAGAYQNLTPQAGHFSVAAARTNGGRHYAASQDIKSILAAQPTGVPLDITVGNIWTPKGNNCTGGFAITYVFKYLNPDATYAPQTRQVLVFDGFLAQGAADAPTITSLTGFTLIGGTRRLGVGIIEGDQGIGGDQLLANGTALADPRITPSVTNNYNASTVDGEQNPIYPNSYGLDAKTQEVPASVMPNGLSSIPITFTTAGDQYFPFLFAFSAPVSTNYVSGTVWNDLNGNGVLDTGEVGIPGVTITVTGTDVLGNPVTRTTTTNGGGGYLVDGLLNGTYTITETQPTAYASSPGTTSTLFVPNVRPPIIFSGTAPTGVTTQNFAEIQSSISGTVYHDQDASGAKNGAEPGISGVTVYLTGTDINGGPVGLTAVTATDGTYKFSNLAPGAYVVSEAQPAGWGDGAETAGSVGGTTTTNDKVTTISLIAGMAATGYNFGEKKAGLSGNVYVDTNNDGTKSGATEVAIAGVTVTVTGTTETGSPVNMVTTTLADGSYAFPTLLPGTYTVTETQPAAFGDGKDTIGTVNGTNVGSVANDQFTNVVLTGSGAGVVYNFGELPGTISGKVWYDKNKDSVVDGTETNIAGVTISLTPPAGVNLGAGAGVAITTTTAADGSYSFIGLPAGSYTITETQPTGYGSSLNGTSIAGVSVPAGGSVVNQNFGETLGSISGTVYLDTVNDNVYTAGERGVSGTTVTLYNAAGTVVATATTDASGVYTFPNLSAGTYRVNETQPAGLTDDADTAGTSGGTVGADQISAIALAAGVAATGYNFGETGLVISGKVYADLNNNGSVDAGEPGIAGVTLTVQVYICPGYTYPIAAGPVCGTGSAAWMAWDSVVTGADGSYASLGAAPSAVYRVIETQPASYADGIDTPGTAGSIQSNDTLQIGALNYSTTIGTTSSINNNFGELAGEISGYIYVDTNNDGLHAGDAGLPGVVVTLTDGTTTWTQVTDAAGKYSFAGLPISAAGITYSITETQPSTYFDGKETSPGTVNPAGVNDKITSVALTTAARVSTENNFGERLGTISGKVWYDSSADGVMDGTETTGIPATITITNGSGTVVWTGTTNPDGSYTSGLLPPGNYTVTETQPAGYGSSTTNAVAVNLNAVAVTGVNFGETLGSLAGAVYVDTNKNGVRDPGESPIGGVIVTLTPPAGVDAGLGAGVAVTTTTLADGTYLFSNLPAADYTLTETQPTLFNDGSETLGTTGGTIAGPDSFTAVSLAGGEKAVGYLFGELSPSVQGTVYYDANNNGTQDSGEPGIPGVVLTLSGTGGVNLTATTDINGDYIFPSVPVATGYTLTETQPTGYGSTEQPTNVITVDVPLTGVIEQNFGDSLSTLAGTVYIDGNNNGVQDSGELGIAGAIVGLIGMNSAGQPISLTTTTDTNGHYLFIGLLSGSYTIEESQPANFVDGKDATGTVTAGAVGAQDSWSAPDRFAGVTLAPQDTGINFNFGEIGTSVGGTVFRDQARNGVYDPSTDVSLAGVIIQLFAANGTTLLDTTTTAADGTYRFTNLPIGTYVVTESQPAGYVDTIGAAGPNTRTVVAPAGGIGGVDFGETLGSILGTVWLDVNKNGVRDGMGDPITPSTDPGIVGVAVTLYDSTGTVVKGSTTTDANGNYIFENLLPGTYVVKESQPITYTDAADFAGSLGGTVANDVLSGIVLAAGGVGTVYDFSEQGAIVSGTVWNDRNGDGIIDTPAEPGRLAGVLITLDDGNPLTPNPTTVTDASGFYQFTGVPVGNYTIIETQPANYASTSPLNDQILVAVALNGSGVAQDMPNQNFGETAGAVGDFVWIDLNGDGVQDAGEPGIPGVTVTLTGTVSGAPVSFTTTTDASGKYSFYDLPFATFTVTVNSATLPAGLTQTIDSDGLATPNASVVTVDATHITSLVQDFGYQGAGAIGNFVWNDLNGDGIQNVGEPGLPGVKVTATVTIAGSPITFTTTTDASGAYNLTGLPYGAYTVSVDPLTLPAGMTETFDASGALDNASAVTLNAATPTSITQDFGYKGAGSIGNFVWNDTNGNGVQDVGEPGLPGVPVTLTTVIAGATVTYTATTDANGAYNVTGLPLGAYTVTTTPDPTLTETFDANGIATLNSSTVTLDAATPASTTQDFGYQGGGSIGDLIWNDLNGDGLRQAGEPGIPGVKVTIVATTAGGPVTFTAVTDANGAYLFSGLPYAAYSVTVDPLTLPAGMTQTGDPDGTKDSASTVTLSAASPSSLVQDFGYKGVGSLGDFIWNDLNGDGLQTSNEPGIPNVHLTVTTVIAGATVTYTTTTDSAGHYSVTGLPLGAFTVTVDSATVPASLTQTGDPDATKDNASTVTLTAVAPTSAVLDFGYKGPGSLGDLVWLDANGNGVRDVGEPGLPGVTVVATTLIGGTVVTYTTTTDAAGAYSIGGLPLGDFTVAVTTASLPAGVSQTFDVDGLATADASTTTLTAAVPADVLQDFGYNGPGTIGNLIWNDLNGDGLQDVGEPGLPGVKVTVTTVIGGATVMLSTVTGADGSYSLVGLPLGSWTVTVDPLTLPAGVSQTGDPDATKDNAATVVLTALAPASTTQDFGYQGVGSIGDLVWVDANGNGLVDAGEAGIAGVGVTITTVIAGATVTYHATTNATGAYLASGLPVGTFTVTVDSATLPAGVTQSFDSDGLATANASVATLTVAAPASLVQDFGYKGPGKIGDTIFNDLNGNGVQDAGEPGIPGVTVSATATVGGSTFTVSAVTAADGSYLISGLPLATFTVKVDPATLPAGMTQTADPDTTKDNTSTVTLTALDPASLVQDFGYQGSGSIGNFIWNDLNGDGVQNANEPGIPGVSVTLTTVIAGAIVTYTTVTDAAGGYVVSGLPLGAFTVAVTTASLPAGMSETFDANGIATLNTSTVTLSAATPVVTDQDFGYQGVGSLGDFVWLDANGNGVQDSGEPGIPGVTVTASTVIAGATVTYTTVTDATGKYTISGLPLGDFTVAVATASLPAGSVQTFDANGIATADSSTTTLTAAVPADVLQDFGYKGPGSIGNLIWNDLNGDGIQDAGEPGLPGVKVTVTTVIGGATVTLSTVTGADGSYSLVGLPLGSWTVTVDPLTLPAGVSQTGDPDATKDNAATVVLTALVPASTTQDFGYQGVGSIGDLIWNDLNGNGLVDAGEPGLPGVKVTITTTIAGAPVTYTATTDATGAYTASGLPLGAFTITVESATLPAGVVETFDTNGIATLNTSTATLSAATPSVTDQDFGYKGPGSIGDFVWLDANGNGVQDAGEPGIPGVTITATTVIAGATVAYSAITDAVGKYTISGLPLGDFTVTAVAASLPAGVVETFDANGIATPNTSTATLSVATPVVTDQDFGYKGPGTIGDLIWNDLNGDGIQNAGEPGLPGVKVTVTTVIGGATVTLTTTTGADGSYRFDGLPLGSWTVTVDPLTLPAGVSQTGDPDATKDNAATVVLTALVPTSTTQDFGYQGVGSIGDLVWVDVNADGVKGPGEVGLAGVGVTITTVIDGATVTYHATSDATGAYVVAGLPLGTFTITVDAASLPAGVTQTFDANGIATANTSTATLSAGTPAALDQDFGYKGPGAIGDTIFNDLNGNGVQDLGEPGLPGVKVSATATIGGATFTVSAVTAADGTYTLAGLPLATFTVTVDPATLPAGVLQTADPDATLNNTSTVTLTAVQPTDVLQDFGYKGPGSIGDVIFNDLNGDGIQQAGEPGIPGVTVTITTVIAGSTVTYTATTDAAGKYIVSGLPLGAFTVTVDPASLPAGLTNTGDPIGPKDGIATVTLSAASPTSATQDFGYQGVGSIGNFIWNDLNAGGVQDIGETGIPGVPVTITTVIAGSTVTYSTVTAADGSYSIAGLPLGDFVVTVDIAAVPTLMIQTFDSDGTGTGTGNTSAVTLSAAVPANTAQDFGYVGDGVIGDLIWNDLNGDGIHTANEPGIPGVKVTITTTVNGTLVTYTDVTDASGAYLIGGLPLGTYTVSVDLATLPAGVTQTGDPDALKDSTATVTLTTLIPLSGAQDFGYQGPGTIGNSIFVDLNADGIQQPTEPGIPGVDVTITTTIAGAVVTYTVTTDANGLYSVAGLPLGTFTVSIDPATLPAGVLPVTDPDATKDNTSTVTLTALVPVDTVQDFGYQGPGSIGDLIWSDQNGNGIVDLGEPGLPGVALTVTTVINGTTVTFPAITDATGAYTVSGLPTGDFTVTVTPATLPAGVVNTGDPVGVQDGVSTLTLTAALPASVVQDFGYQGPGVIGDLIWNDLNGDGIKDPNEPGIPGVKVIVTTVINGTTVTYTATTDATGTYTVSGLPLGDFTVTVDPTSVPAGLLPTGDATGAKDGVSTVTLTAVAPTSSVQDFAYQGPGVIGDLVWNDLNGDGIKTPNEPGLPGVVITVTTVIAGATVTYTTVTDATGTYQIAGLPLGTFTVAVDPTTLPAGVLPTADPDGGADNKAVVTLTAVAPTTTVQDFGYAGAGVIGDLIWSDVNGDGVKNAVEPGLPGVTVTVTTTVNGMQVTYITTTDATGSYTIPGLPFGQFTVTVDPATLPGGVVNVGDPDGGNNNTAAIALTVAAPTSLVQDFGYQGPGVIGNSIWNDLNGDGIQTPNEPGLPGIVVTATVTIHGVPVTYTVTTGPDGTYTFSGLPLGAYTVAVDPATLPDGVVPSFDSDDPADGSIATPNTAQVTLTAAVPTSSVQDFGYQGPGVIGNLVWNDLNGNGVADTGEPGFPNVALTITTTVNGTVVTYPVTTDATGAYSVPGLPLGSFTVTLHPAALPATVKPSYDGDGIATVNTSAVTLTAEAPTSPVQDFGYFIPTSIGDLVWNDLNANGVQDAGEPGLGGVTVLLVGTDGLGNSVELTATTGAGPDLGKYLFADLAPGTYTVTVTAPAALLEAPVASGTDRLVDSNGLISPVVLVSGTPQPGVDVGLYQLSAISGVVYADLDADGTQGTNCLVPTRQLLSAGTNCEMGIGGVTITLTGITGAGVAVTLTTTTAVDGSWSFTGLVPGAYTVTETQPTQWSDGTDGLPPGAVSSVNDVISNIMLLSGTPVTSVSFGEQGWPVTGTVKLDGSGAPIAGVVVTLTGTDVLGEHITMTITTGADGSFNFKNVPAGSYTLTESQPAGLENGSVNPGNVIAFVLGAEAIPSHDFTETASSIAGSAYIDINKNGVNDAGDLPNPGVLITLTGTDAAGNPVNRTVIAGADGTWLITDIRAGDYQITETQPPTMVDGAATVGNAGGTATSANVIVLSLRPGISATGYLFGDVRRNLPVTGADVRNVLGLAVLTLAAGVPLVMVGRRRNRVRLAK